MNRRDFLRVAGAFGTAVATFSPLELLAEDDISPEIKTLLSRETVDDILKESLENKLITKINITERDSTEYDKQVYQKEEKTKKPVIVFVYNSKGTTQTALDAQRRVAVVFRRLAEMYESKILFVAYDTASDKAKTAKKEGFKNYPSIGMYSTFDLLKGETLSTNDGRIKQVDIRLGGPKENTSVASVIDSLSSQWIKTNLTNPNQTFVKRYENKMEGMREIVYNQR